MARILILAALLLTHARILAFSAPTSPDESVTYRSGAVTIACTLSLPAGNGRFPAVALLSGSGPQDRDSELGGFRPFKLMSDFLVGLGIAVLRCDDRGVGGSSGSVQESTTRDFADDALAAVRMLRARAEIDAARVGLAGHSEGAVVAAIAASVSSDVRFVVWLAGNAVSGAEILGQQAEAMARAGGATDAEVREIGRLHAEFLAAIASDVPEAQLVAMGRTLASAQLSALPEAKRPTPADLADHSDRLIQQSLSILRSPWGQSFIKLDPSEVLHRVTCPVFAAFGGRDLQVPAALNRPRLESALNSAGNTRVTVREYPEANHLFQRSVTGQLSEYATLPKEFVPSLLEDIARWIEGQR
jgi:uncharacterized protein